MRETDGTVETEAGVRLFFRVIEDGPGVTIVPNALYLFDAFRRLARGRTLIFVDWRNRGRSDAVSERSALERGIRHDVDDLEAVRRHFDAGRVSVIAHSYSGLTAALYAMEHAERVERVVMIGPMQPFHGKQYAAELQCADATSLRFAAEFRKLQGERGMLEPVEFCKRAWALLRELYVADAADADKLGWEPCDVPNEMAFMRHWMTNLLPSIQGLGLTAERIGQIGAPVLVIHGHRDRSAPYGGGREWAELLPNARLLTIEQGAHVPWIEAPDAVFGSIDVFLNGQWPAESRGIAETSAA